MRHDHPLLHIVAVAADQAAGLVTVNLKRARRYLDAIPDGWVKLDGEWVQLEHIGQDPTDSNVYTLRRPSIPDPNVSEIVLDSDGLDHR